MKSFDEMIMHMNQENYTIFIDKIVSEKVPVACFVPEKNAENLKFYQELLDQGFNLTDLLLPPVHVSKSFHSSKMFKCIIAKNKLAASFLRIPEL